MGKFDAKKLPFGKKQNDNQDDGEGLPSPILIKMSIRREIAIREAKTILAVLPKTGESLHAVATARMDLTDVIEVLFERFGGCTSIHIATLGFNEKNLRSMISWIDRGRVSSLNLLSAIFLRAHKPWLWGKAMAQFIERGHAIAAAHSHAKVVALKFRSGDKLSIEGSANLCGNGSGREQFAVINDAGLCDWHANWIKELMIKNGSEQPEQRPS